MPSCATGTASTRCKQGEPIGRRANGELITAPHDGWIVFPFAAAQPRQEWFYLARASRRFD